MARNIAPKFVQLENCAEWHHDKADRAKTEAERERHEAIGADLMWRAYRLRQAADLRPAA